MSIWARQSTALESNGSSGLGEKLQLLAKIETQKLNAAREEGLSLRKSTA